MSIVRMFTLAIVVVALSGCSGVNTTEATTPHRPPPAPGAPADFSVTLERTACCGGCPVYTVTVMADGGLTFEGVDHVASQGVHISRVGGEVVIELLTAVVKSDFFNFDACYCSERFFDAPTSVITVTLHGVTHTVTHLKGDLAPEGLLSLEETIDRVSRSDRWVKGPE